MSFCEICGKDLSTSHYHLAAEIKQHDNNKIKFVHMECCSAEEIKKNLLLYAQNQAKLYQDIVDLAKNTTLDKIKDHQRKYGTYEEISQGIQIDRDHMSSALISELKSKIERQ